MRRIVIFVLGLALAAPTAAFSPVNVPALRYRVCDKPVFEGSGLGFSVLRYRVRDEPPLHALHV